MTIAVEEKRVRSLFERVEAVEEVAMTLADGDERRAKLLAVSNAALADEGTVRPVIAARLLGLSEKTVRAWAAEGVLTVAQRSPRLLLDVQSVHAVSHIIRELRSVGKDRDLLDEVWRRLTDAALLERDELKESIEQMRRGEGRFARFMAGGCRDRLAAAGTTALVRLVPGAP
jgi:DNA-binding transcriptional MerR regulator